MVHGLALIADNCDIRVGSRKFLLTNTALALCAGLAIPLQLVRSGSHSQTPQVEFTLAPIADDDRIHDG